MNEGEDRKSGFGFKGVGKAISFNRPSSRRGIEVSGFVKPGINYGSVAGSSAKFIGQGILNLKRGGGARSFEPPFYMQLREDRVTVAPGTLDGILPFNYINAYRDGLSLVPRFALIVLQVTTDGKRTTSYQINTTDMQLEAPQPTSPLAPNFYSWPIGVVENGTLSRLIGNSSLVSRAIEVTREVRATTIDVASPGYESYFSWSVSNFLL